MPKTKSKAKTKEVKALKQAVKAEAKVLKHATKAAKSKRPKRKGKLAPGMVKGHGGYWGNLLGTLAGSLVGQPELGGRIGDVAGDVVSKIFGHGDYTLKHNSLLKPMDVMGNSPPVFSSQTNCRIKHKEFLCNIYASSSMQIQAFNVNPGLLQTFPWLSNLAANFQQYKMHGMLFCFQERASMTSAAVGLGTVVIATNYDTTAPAFQNSWEARNAQYATSTAPTVSAIHGIECAKSQNPVNEFYIRTGPVRTGTDQRLDDLCTTYVINEGQTGTGIIGEIWVTYDIELMKPRMIAELGGDALDTHYSLSNTTGADPLGSVTPSYLAGPLNVTFTPYNSGTTRTLTLNGIQEGLYLFTFNWILSAGAASNPGTVLTGAVFTNCALFSYFGNGTLSSVSSFNNATESLEAILLFCIKVTGQNPTIQLHAPSPTFTTAWNADMIISVVTTPGVQSQMEQSIDDRILSLEQTINKLSVKTLLIEDDKAERLFRPRKINLLSSIDEKKEIDSKDHNAFMHATNGNIYYNKREFAQWATKVSKSLLQYHANRSSLLQELYLCKSRYSTSVNHPDKWFKVGSNELMTLTTFLDIKDNSAVDSQSLLAFKVVINNLLENIYGAPEDSDDTDEIIEVKQEDETTE